MPRSKLPNKVLLKAQLIKIMKYFTEPYSEPPAINLINTTLELVTIEFGIVVPHFLQSPPISCDVASYPSCIWN